VDAFRDFEAEARRAGASGSGGGAADATAGGPAGGGLSELFKPPERILFKGPFEAAKAAGGSRLCGWWWVGWWVGWVGWVGIRK